MTDGELNEYARSLINEATEKFWKETELAIYKKVAKAKLLAQFWTLLYPFYKKHENLTVTALNPEVALPADYYRLGKMEIKSTGEVLQYFGNENELADYAPDTPGTPQGWTFYNKKFKFIPTPTEASTDYYRVWYMPKLSETADFPEELHALIGVEMCFAAKIKDEDTINELRLLQAQFTEAAEVAFSAWQIQEPDSLPGSIDEQYGI